MTIPREVELPARPCPRDFPFAPFTPHPLLRNRHLQTLASAWFTGAPSMGESSVERLIVLPDGDQLVIHDDCPAQWEPSDPVAVLLHGLCGSAQSPYLSRIAAKLNGRGLRTFRVDMRGAGAGHGLAKHAYHAGRSEDLAAVVDDVHDRCPDSPILTAGFSLGGNILLKWLGEQRGSISTPVTRAIAVNPPVDLQLCTDHLSSMAGGFYDRHFAKLLYHHVRETPHWRETIPAEWLVRRPRRLLEFDELFTAPRAGFRSAAEYYHQCSSARVIAHIDVPTLILSSRDDPLIPVRVFENLDLPDCVRLYLSPCGGHLGYIGRKTGNDPDRLWMDWRVVDWLTLTSQITI